MRNEMNAFTMPEPLVLIAILAMVVCSVVRAETCDVDIAQYCCRNRTLAESLGFKLSCFSATNGILAVPDHQSAATSDCVSAPLNNPRANVTTRKLAFEISVQYSALEVLCIEAAPNVPSLLKYLKVVQVTSLKYIACEMPQGSLSFGKIFEGNSLPIFAMSLKDPLSVPNRTLQGSLFEGISGQMAFLEILQSTADERLDLSDNFFKGFGTLKRVHLGIHTAKIPPDLKSLPELSYLHLEKIDVSELTFEPFSGLGTLEELHVTEVSTERFGARPFSDLKKLRILSLEGLHAAEIPEELFSGLDRLNVLEISRWSKLSVIQAGTMSGISNLMYLKLEALPILEELPSGLFEGLSRLGNLHIIDCGLRYLPMKFWLEKGGFSTSLHTVFMAQNHIEMLPDYFFQGNYRLGHLNLEQNHIRKIGRSLGTLKSLKELNLAGNELQTISKNDFRDLEHLIYLNLRMNEIGVIEHGALANLKHLEVLELSHNRLQHFTALLKVENSAIKRVVLSKNELTGLPDIPFDNLSSFSVLEMDDNLVTSFDVPVFRSGMTTVSLRSNRIELISIKKLEELKSLSRGVHSFNVAGNPFECGAGNFVFLDYIQRSMRPEIAEFEELENCICSDSHRKLTEVNLEELSSEVNKCPNACECFFFPSNASTDVRCRHRNLERIPVLPPEVTDLDFEGNALESFPVTISRYRFLRVVKLKRNRIRTIDGMISLVPVGLRFLYLDFNQLERVNIDPGTSLRFEVALSNNPWKCDCDSRDLKSFLDMNAPKILDYSTIECQNSIDVDDREEFLLARIPPDSLCPKRSATPWLTTLSISLPSGLMLFAVVLYFRNSNLIRALIYVRFNGLFQFLSRESDLDKTKYFDAFLSYANEDREVALEILNRLESIDSETLKHLDVPFKLCFHERDFVAGQSINWNILAAVKRCHRTIIILSESFLKSSWFTIEFKAAYDQMLDDPNNRLIIVIKGDLPKLENLDTKLRAVLSTKTYLVWGERWFWKKLLYAMPHKKHRPPVNYPNTAGAIIPTESSSGPEGRYDSEGSP